MSPLVWPGRRCAGVGRPECYAAALNHKAVDDAVEGGAVRTRFKRASGNCFVQQVCHVEQNKAHVPCGVVMA
jgi:hypothetical protein